MGVTFTGDSLYNPTTPRASSLIITKADTEILAPKVAGTLGKSISINATLLRLTNGGGIGGASVSYKLDGTTIGSTLTGGTGIATLVYKIDAPLTIGTHTLVIDFAGDTNHNASTVSKTLRVDKAPTRLTINTQAAKVGGIVTFKSKMTRRIDGFGLVGKTVSFLVDGVVVGSAVTGATSFAELTFTVPNTLSVGLHTLSASFAGDASYLTANSSISTLTVKP